MLFSVGQLKGQSFSEDTINNVKYVQENQTQHTIRVSGTADVLDENLTIESSVTQSGIEWKVVKLSNGAFNNTTNTAGLKTVTIPKTITEVGAGAFQNCKALEKVTFESGADPKLNNAVFQNCENLTEIENFPQSITAVNAAMFQNCKSLTSFTVPSGVTSFGSNCFSGCTALTSINIPAGVTSIGNNAFQDCSALTTVGTLPEGLTTIGNEAFKKCKSLNGPIVIPKTLTSVGNSAFFQTTSLKSVTFADRGDASLTIGAAAFEQSGITKIVLPEGVTVLQHHTFHQCKSLAEVTLSTKLTKIEYNCFNECSALTTVTNFLPTTLTELGALAFNQCTSLSSDLVIPASLAKIGKDAFNSAKAMKNVTFAPRTESDALDLASYVFKKSGITKVELPDCLTEIPVETFIECESLTEVTLPSKLVTLNTSCFKGCKNLTTVNNSFPTTLVTIGESAFHGCTSLASEITIPASVKSIGKDAFTATKALKTVIFAERDGSAEDVAYTMGDYVFNESGIETAIRLPKGLKKIGQQSFHKCESLKGISLPVTLEEIGERAFEQCKSITSLVIPAAVQSIGTFAFYTCTNLETLAVNIDQPTITLGNQVFDACGKLSDISFHGNFEKIPSGMFWNCHGLTSVTFPKSISEIGDKAFYMCENLKTLTFEHDTPPIIGSMAFSVDGTSYSEMTSVETIEYSCKDKQAYESDEYNSTGKDFLTWFSDQYPGIKKESKYKHDIEHKSVLLIDRGEPAYLDGTICDEFATGDTVTIQVGGSFAFDATDADVLNKVKNKSFIIEQEMNVDQWNFVGPGIDDTKYEFLTENHGLHGHHDIAAVGYDYENNDWASEYAYATDPLPMHKVDGVDDAIGGIMAYVFDYPPITFAGSHYKLGDATVILPKHINKGDLWELYKANGTGEMGTVQFSLENNGPINSENGSSTVKGLWYALHNLYVGRLDVTKFLAQNAAQGNTLYTYDNDAWVAHESGTSDDALKEIRPGKGFMVAAKEPASGTDDEKLAAQRTFNAKFETSMINHITNAKKSSTTQADYVIFSSKANGTERTMKAALDKNAKNGFDGEDAYVMISTNRDDFAEPYFVVDNRRIMTDKFKSLPYVVPVNFHAGKTSDVEFSLTQIPNGMGVELIDTLSGEHIDLTDGKVYNFVADSGENSSRFFVKFYSTNVSDGIVSEEQSNIEISYYKRTVFVNTTDKADVEIINSLGQTVRTQPINAGSSQITLDNQNGMYVVKVRTSNNERIKKIVVK